MPERQVALRNGLFETQLVSEGSGPPLLFLHSVPRLLPEAPGLQRLAERYTVLAPALPGFGASTGIEQVDDVLDLAGWAYDLLDVLGVASVPIVGHGLGGMVAAEMAAMCSHGVNRLILVSPFGLWLSEAPAPDPFTMSPAAFARHVFANPESEQAAAYTPPSGAAQSSEIMVQRTQNLASLGKFIWPLPDKGLKKRMHRIKTPTLLLWGESDGLTPPAYGEAFRSRLPDARLETIPEASHMLIVEQPDAFADAVLTFLRQ